MGANSPNQLYKWKKEIDDHGEAAFPGQGGRPKKISNNEMALLKAELKKLREENEILKKAAIYFAKEFRWSMFLLLKKKPVLYHLSQSELYRIVNY